MKYTAEEVRKSADWLYQWERKAGARNARAMLTAYADLLEQIKADEGVANKLVAPVAWMCETVNGYKVFNPEGPSFPCNAGVVSELFTHPPAQAAQVEDDDDGLPIGFADWYNRTFAGQHVDCTRMDQCERAWRYALASQPSEPAAEPGAQGEVCKICGKDTPHHHLRGTQVRYRSIQEEWSEWLEFNLVCADAALWKLSAIGAITPPEAASIKAVIAGARAMLAAPSAPEADKLEAALQEKGNG